MNEPFTNKTEAQENEIAEKLQAVADQTHATPYFVGELEEQLRAKHKPKAGWLMAWRDLTPSLGWVALVLAVSILLILSIRTLVPAPQPASDETPSTPADTHTPTAEPVIEENTTPVPETGGFDWRGSRLHLSVPLPQSRGGANLYVLTEEQPATMDTALALASQFGFQGEIYEMPAGAQNTPAYLVTDGRQRLIVQSDLHYDYYSDYSTFTFMSGDRNITPEQAGAAIDGFLKSHGFEFKYQVEIARQSPGMFFVLPLTPDGLTIRHDYNMPARIEFTIGENQQVIRVSSYQVSYENSGGTYGIRSAEEAFQQVLDQSDRIQNGVLEIARSTGESNAGYWSRGYPDNQMITIFGQPTYYPAAVPGTAPFVSIGQWVVTGNIGGLENVDRATYVGATGQFITESGVRKFNVDTWKVTTSTEAYISGSLRRDGDQIILTADDGSGEYVIEDAPADVPLNTTPGNDYLAVNGFMVAGKLHWQSIQYYPAGSGRGGGGGGSGTGFYQLNLSGTPVPLPTEQSTQDSSEYIVTENDTLGSIAANFGVTVDQLVEANNLPDANIVFTGQKLIIPGLPSSESIVGKIVALRGIFTVTTYRKGDGKQRTEYGLNLNPNENPFFFATLEDNDLQNLQAYHNRPIDVWGTVERLDQNGNPVVKVDRYEIPFPDLQFQILQGKQKLTEIDGEQVALFTSTDGTTYAQLMTIGAPDATILGSEGSDVIIEALLIPGETLGDYPALRMFSGAVAVNPKDNDNQPVEMTITADQSYVVEEQPGMENYIAPSATIEKVELVYYSPDPLYGNADPANSTGAKYIQPAWRFYGHYSNGDEFEFLVQALKQEYLLPELAPYRTPG
jgi:LysM repeat protein